MKYTVYRYNYQKIILCIQEVLSNLTLQKYWMWLEDKEYRLSNNNSFPHYEGRLDKEAIIKDIYKEGYLLLFLEDK